VAIVPILTYAVTMVIRIDALSRRRVFGILLGLAAVVLLVGPESSLPNRGMVPWVLVSVLASAFYAVENVYIAVRRPSESDTLVLAGGMLLMAALILAPVVAATGSFVPLGLPWGPVEWSVAGMMVANAIAYTLFIHVVQTAGPVFASQTAYTVTISGVFWGMAIFGEQHSLWIWAALTVMLAGLALVNPRGRG
jgi:drug/metabolite transporter (DMT)-like permease